MSIFSRVSRVGIPLVLAILGLIAGCSGYRTYQPGDFSEWPPKAGQVHEFIEVGDRVRVAAERNAKVDGVIESLGVESMIVSGKPVAYASITSLQVKGFLWEPTVVVAGTAAFGVMMLTLGGIYSPNGADAGAK